MNKRVALFWFNLNYTCSDNIIRAHLNLCEYSRELNGWSGM